MRRTRHKLAPPFVVTLALLPACKAQDGATEDPGRTSKTVATIVGSVTPPSSQEPTQNPPAHVSDAGSAVPYPPKSATRPASWRVSRDAKGTGCISHREPHCPPNVACNPPPPKPAACPPGMGANSLVMTKVPDGTECEYLLFGGGGNCPPNTKCNPPPPERRRAPCPD
jgi:hypothetical protein